MGMAFRGLNALNPAYDTVGNGMPQQMPDPLAGLPMAQAQAPQPSMPIAPQMPQLTNGQFDQRIQPSTWGHGGKGWDTVGAVFDALSALGGKGTPYHDSQLETGQRDLANQFKQQQLMIEAWKARQANRTPFQNNFEYLNSIGRPDAAATYLNAETNPQILVTDPATGNTRFAPKGGIPGMGMAPQTDNVPTVSSDADYNALPSGAHFRDPEGNLRKKP